MMNIPSFYLEPANYAADFPDLHYLRTEVFVVEQGIAPEIEFDDLDRDCRHLIARDAARRPIGCGRLSPTGRIGRMAVLPAWRRQKVGESLLRGLIELAGNLGLSEVTAHAQIAALGFYRRYGFQTVGAEFLEAGIPHTAIRLTIAAPAPMSRQSEDAPESSVPAIRLQTPEAAAEAALALVQQARRLLCIYSRNLDSRLYSQKPLVEALKQFALRNQRGAEVRIIVQEPEAIRGQQLPLIDLAQRLPSYIAIRAAVEAEDLNFRPAFIANDNGGYLFQLQSDRYDGHWSPNLPAQNRQLSEEFERVWQRARICSEFRALAL
ncbi:GNAT family N-acetyltransferase [Methylomonas sp. EFPC3]|uniref:GNAT family N-acetyltransferase n=1 Tax=Methylomonas sp. EFPC3 TaxID=3021710 RepID=UPI0024165A31|nr:GNAT family N-acetyltransferase [Methylomonas sp. EFPC3]WFP51558.1 GNAT family N-acetyltransferase [Methylomonas sp. EFPC3]